MDEHELLTAINQLSELGPEPPHNSWDRHRYELRKHIRTGDMHSFLRWSTITATMFVGNFSKTQAEMRDLLGANKDWARVVSENWVGNPEPMIAWPFTSGNMVHQAYHLSRMFSDGSGVAKVKSVVEFGGGYGAMRYLFNRLGCSGRYTIYDLPEFSLLQQYYLEKLDLPTVFRWVENEQFADPRDETDLLIALYSLSEVSDSLRQSFIERINPRRLLIAHQDAFISKNLAGDFRALCYAMIDYEWTFIENQYFHGHWYILGEKRA
jgi:hypothetical protein